MHGKCYLVALRDEQCMVWRKKFDHSQESVFDEERLGHLMTWLHTASCGIKSTITFTIHLALNNLSLLFFEQMNKVLL